MEPITLNINIKLNADKILVETVSKLIGLIDPSAKSSVSGIVDTDKGPIVIQAKKPAEPAAEEPSPKGDEVLTTWGPTDEALTPKQADRPNPRIEDEPEEPEGESPLDWLDDKPAEKLSPKGNDKPKELTHEDCMKALAGAKGRGVQMSAIKAVMAEYKANTPADIDKKDYAEFIGKLKALKGAN